MNYLYLSINLISFAIPFSLSFLSKEPFFKKWKYLGISTLVTALFFLILDELFIQMGTWGFNPDLLLGIYLFNIPLEEVLYFLCIPYAFVFTYYVLTQRVEKDHLFPHQELISSSLIVLLLIFGMYHLDKVYTCITFILLGLFLAYQMLKIKPRYMGRFYFAFIFLLVPLFFVRGILTGLFTGHEIIWYKSSAILGIRLATVPLEDLFYTLLLLLMNIVIFEGIQEWEYYRKK